MDEDEEAMASFSQGTNLTTSTVLTDIKEESSEGSSLDDGDGSNFTGGLNLEEENMVLVKVKFFTNCNHMSSWFYPFV